MGTVEYDFSIKILSPDELRDIILTATGEDVEAIERIIFFGSRARGNPHQWSDYDILIFIKNEMSDASKKKMRFAIRMAIEAPVDLFIEYMEREKEFLTVRGFNVHLKEALKEGKVLYQRNE